MIVSAARGGHINLVRFMMEKKTEMSAHPVQQQILLAAAGEGHEEIVALALANGVDPNSITPTQTIAPKTPLEAAAKYGHENVVRLLLSQGAKPIIGRSANKNIYYMPNSLIHAIRRNRLRIAQMLIDHGAELNPKNLDHYHPLRMAVVAGKADMVRLLLENAATFINRPTEGHKAYLLAKSRGKSEVVALLVKYGVETEV